MAADQFGDKTFTQIQDSFGSFLGGGEDDDGGGGLFQAVLPAAVVGLLTVALSTLFVNQVALNSTSNGTFPLLFQLPEQLGRRRRDVVQQQLDDDDDDEGHGASGGLATRLKDAMVLYALMERDLACRSKVACIFGRETRRSPQRGWIERAVRAFAPKGFKDEFWRSLEDVDGAECATLECSQCFTL